MVICRLRIGHDLQSTFEAPPFRLLARQAKPQPLGLLSKAAHVDALAAHIIGQSLRRAMARKPEKRGPTYNLASCGPEYRVETPASELECPKRCFEPSIIS
jgi:hypothetical protein